MIDLATYPNFRIKSLELKSNISSMINEMDGVMDSVRFTDAAKSQRLQALVQKYLP